MLEITESGQGNDTISFEYLIVQILWLAELTLKYVDFPFNEINTWNYLNLIHLHSDWYNVTAEHAPHFLVATEFPLDRRNWLTKFMKFPSTGHQS